MKKLYLASMITLFANTPSYALDGLEVGARVWFSEGETEWSHCASVSCGGASDTVTIGGTSYTYYGGDPTSRLNYSGTEADIYEIYANLPINSFIGMAKIGTGSGDGGSFRDQDWLTIAGVYENLEFSDTLSDVKGTDVDYWMIDLGYPIKNEKYTITPFIGYFQYDEQLSAYGLTPVSDGDLNISSSISYSTEVIRNRIEWDGVRIGADIRTKLKDKISASANLAYAIVDAKNKDSHLLRTSNSDLGPAPNIISDGDGNGIMLDFSINYAHSDVATFELGYRYWDLDADSATTKFGPDFSTAYPSRSLYSKRDGLFLGASYKF